ncbi:MAG: hypothetical protein PHN94_11435 [Bacteroidales bacterium]|nr:hypothetical protein [Bacteroidales bacterium]
MKIFKLTILSLAVFVLAAITYSCSKQDQAEPVSSTTEISQSEADILIENKIRAFKSKMEFQRENPSYKSGETMSVDSAVWYMEAASNYTYGDGASTFNKTICDTFSIVLDVADGVVNLNDVVAAYDDMIQNLSATYNAIPGGNNHLVVNDISLTAMDESTLTLGVNAVFGESTDGTSANFNYAWYYGHLMGREDGAYAGISDAAEEIEKKIHLRKGVLPRNSYYTNVDSVEVYGSDFINPNDPIPGDNMYDFLMFSNISNGITPNEHELLSIDEMNFYLFGTEQVIYNFEPDGARPEGLSFISVDLKGELIMAYPVSVRNHQGWIRYGELHISGIPHDDL